MHEDILEEYYLVLVISQRIGSVGARMGAGKVLGWQAEIGRKRP